MNETREINDLADPRLRLRQARAAALLSLLFVVVYGGSNWIASQRAHVGTLAFGWERRIPFVPLMILPYMSIDLFFVAAPFLCRDRKELATYVKRIRFAILVAGVFFLALPLRLTFLQPAVTGWLGAIFNFLHGFDQPHNLFPSLHIAQLAIMAGPYERHTRGPLRGLLRVWFILIACSTVLTYQHQVLDVLGGLMLAACGFYFIRENPPGPLAVKNTRIGRRYGLGALALLALGVLGWPWLGAALWPAAALGLAAAAYCGLWPALYRKENGRLPSSARWILGPLILGQWLSLFYYRRQCRPWDEVCPGVWLGRQLSAAESRRARRLGVRAVLDLTAEFSETPAFREAEYLNIPILDLTAPTPAELEQGAQFIGEQLKRGTVYVHCKIGYSRSAVMVGAWMMRSGQAQTAAEAMARIREKRPSVVFRAEAVEALEKMEEGRGIQNSEYRIKN